MNKRKILKYALLFLLLLSLAPFVLFIWQSLYTRHYDVNYPEKVIIPPLTKSINTENTTCPHSQVVEVMNYLIDFNINKNEWVANDVIYKNGIFFVIPWASTPFLDNKASFQLGVHDVIKRMSIELEERLGRIRGTSSKNIDLQKAREDLHYGTSIGYINLFDGNPFMAVAAETRYRNAMKLYQNFNNKLASCEMVFDPRADNLRATLDSLTNAIGSIASEMDERSTHIGRGWFDFKADNYYYEALGMIYAYQGLIQAMEADFADVIKDKGLTLLWQQLSQRAHNAASLRPLIISNGVEDGWIMPTHLNMISQKLLLLRSQLVEARDILDR